MKKSVFLYFKIKTMVDITTIKESLPFSEIKRLYPDEWVLIGNPVLNDPDILEAVVHKIMSGIVLYHSKNKTEIGHNAKSVKHGYHTFACVYTGEIPRNRRFWLSNW